MQGSAACSRYYLNVDLLPKAGALLLYAVLSEMHFSKGEGSVNPLTQWEGHLVREKTCMARDGHVHVYVSVSGGVKDRDI